MHLDVFSKLLNVLLTFFEQYCISLCTTSNVSDNITANTIPEGLEIEIEF